MGGFPYLSIDDWVQFVDQEIERAAAHALEVKNQLKPQEWARKRAGATKRLYNLMERRTALLLAKQFPNAVYLYDVKAIGLTGEAAFLKPRRVYDAAQVKNNLVQPLEMKSPTVVPASVKGGMSNDDIEAIFRQKDGIGAQLKKEKNLIAEARRKGKKIILEGVDALSPHGAVIRIEVDPNNLRISRVVRYGELPDKHLFTEALETFPSGRGAAAGGVAVAGRGAGSGNSAPKTAWKIDDGARGLDDAARGLSNTERGLANSLGSSTARRVASASGGRLSTMASATLRGGRAAVTAVRIATRVVGRIALEIILPPFTPGAILLEVTIFLLFSWFEKLEKEAEERAVRKALEAIQPQMHDAVKLPSKRAEAAALLVKDWEAGGVGFVYLSLDISLYKDEKHKTVRKSEHDGLARTTVPSVEKFTEWSAKFNGLSFSNRYVRAPNPKPETRSMGQDWERTIYPLRFMEQVPFLTIFDLLSAKFSSLLAMLDEARWSLVDHSWDNPEFVERSIASDGAFGSSPQNDVTLSGITYPYEVDAASYAVSIREIQHMISQLQSHRSPLGAKMRILMAPDTRRMLLYGVHKGMQSLVKEVGSIYKSQAGAPVAKEPADPFLEAVDLVQQIAKDCERAIKVDKKFFVYDFDEEVRKYLMAQ